MSLSSLSSARQKDFLAVGLFVFLAVVFLWPALLPGKTLVPTDLLPSYAPWSHADLNFPPPHNLDPSDVIDYIYPIRSYAAQTIQQGDLPLWNPYAYAGYPFIGNAQAGLFYPFSILFYILPIWLAINLYAVTHIALAGVFMYLFLRSLSASRPAAVFAGIAFMFSGEMVVWLEWTSVLGAMVWLPLALFALERTVQRQKLGWAILTGGAVACILLGGHLQWSLYGLLATGLYGAFRTLMTLWDHRQIGWRALQPALLAGLGIGAGVLLAAIQLMPTLEYISAGHRQRIAYEALVTPGWLKQLIVFWIPRFFGDRLVPTSFWGSTNYTETTTYFGLLPLLLALMVLLVRHDRVTVYFSAFTVFVLSLLVGSPVYRLLYSLPGFNSLPIGRLVYLVSTGGAILAGLSLDGLSRLPPQRRKRTFVGLTLIAASLLIASALHVWYYWPYVAPRWIYERTQFVAFGFFLLIGWGLTAGYVRRRIRTAAFLGGAILLAVIDLFHAGFGYNTVSDIRSLFPATPLIEFLQQDEERFRIMTLREQPIFLPNFAAIYGLQDIGGYDSVMLTRYRRFMSLVEQGLPTLPQNPNILLLSRYNSELLNLLNVKYILTKEALPEENPGFVGTDVRQEVMDGWAELPQGQSFLAENGLLNRVDLLFRVPKNSNGTIVFHLRKDRDAPDLARIEIDFDALPPNGHCTFFFEPIPRSKGQSYFLYLESTAATPGAVAISKNDAYSYGTRVDMTTELPGDLWFAAYNASPIELVYEAEARIYRNRLSLPRAMLLHRVETFDGEEAVLQRMATTDFAPAHTTLLEKTPPAHWHPSLEPVDWHDDRLQIVSYEPNRIVIETYSATDSLLRLAEVHYPGWEVTVDGQRRELYRADYLLRGVFVEQGEHVVEFRFRPRSFLVGSGVSLSTLAVLAIAGGIQAALGMRSLPSRA
jgi:hypothetical protein